MGTEIILLYHRSLSSFSIAVLYRLWKAASTSWKARVLLVEAPSRADCVVAYWLAGCNLDHIVFVLLH